MLFFVGRRAVLLAVAQHAVDDARLCRGRACASLRPRAVRNCSVALKHVAARADVDEEVQRELLVAERVREADREVRLAVVAGVDERRRAQRQARGRVDQQLALRCCAGRTGRSATAWTGPAPCRCARCRTATCRRRTTRAARSAARALCRARWSKFASTSHEKFALEHRRAAHRDLDAFVSRHGAVQVEQDEAGRVAAADVVDDLVLRLLAVVR